MIRKTLCVNGFSYFGIIRVWDVRMHLLGSSENDLLTCDGKLGMTM